MGSPTATILLIFLLLVNVQPNESLPFSQFHSLLSLSHSLISRVSNLRAARGDYAGAARARQISKNIERGLGMGFVKLMFTIGYDYVGEMKDLISLLSEFIQLKSVERRTAWVGRNHRKLIKISRSLIKVFGRSEVLEALYKEVVEGELLKDCVEVAGNDLIAIVKVLKDIATDYYYDSSSSSSSRTDL